MSDSLSIRLCVASAVLSRAVVYHLCGPIVSSCDCRSVSWFSSVFLRAQWAVSCQFPRSVLLYLSLHTPYLAQCSWALAAATVKRSEGRPLAWSGPHITPSVLSVHVPFILSVKLLPVWRWSSIKRSTIEIWCAPLWLRESNRWRGKREEGKGVWRGEGGMEGRRGMEGL